VLYRCYAPHALSAACCQRSTNIRRRASILPACGILRGPRTTLQPHAIKPRFCNRTAHLLSILMGRAHCLPAAKSRIKLLRERHLIFCAAVRTPSRTADTAPAPGTFFAGGRARLLARAGPTRSNIVDASLRLPVVTVHAPHTGSGSRLVRVHAVYLKTSRPYAARCDTQHLAWPGIWFAWFIYAAFTAISAAFQTVAAACV